MIKTEILEALPKLSPEERREIRAKLNELDGQELRFASAEQLAGLGMIFIRNRTNFAEFVKLRERFFRCTGVEDGHGTQSLRRSN